MTVQELLQATADGKLGQLLDARGGELTPDLAREAREVFKQAVGAGNGALAQVAAMAASMVWLRLGDRREALINFIDSKQLDYMRAETPPQYAEARAGLLQARDMGNEIDARDQAFKAATIAADCSFWAAQASDPKPRADLLLQTLRDIIAASQLAEADGDGDFERYVSLTAAAANEAMSTVWPEREAEAHDLLRQLAAVADQTIPAQFTYSQAGDIAKTGATAQTLAALADEYGN